MHILITGGTGFIGICLSDFLLKKGFKVSISTRDPKKQSIKNHAVRYLSSLEDISNLEDCFDIIINLAGASLNKKRWNRLVKKEIYDSRIKTTQKILNYIIQAPKKPQLLISGSAIGFYGHSRNTIFTEASKPTPTGFTDMLCHDWEHIAEKASKEGVRVCCIRTGIVLGKNGGALKEMYLPFRLGLGAQFGDGQEFMSWIHIQDWLGIVDKIIEDKTIQGPVNLTAPNPVTHQIFVNALATVLHRKVRIVLSPFWVKLFFGEMGERLLLQGQRVIPDKILKAGYVFQFPELTSSFKNLL